jgi:putative sigma-54 modulation protein
MRLQVKGKNVEISPSIREHAERKLAKLTKQLADQTQVEVELSEQKNPSIADRCVGDATIYGKGTTLRAREASPDMKATIDQLAANLERQVKRYRERRIVEPRRHTEHHGETTTRKSSPGGNPAPAALPDDSTPYDSPPGDRQ